MGNWGLKVSLPTKDISSSIPEDYVFSSKFGTVKIVQEPSGKVPIDVTVNGSTTLTLTIEHNLGFIPLCMIFAERKASTGRYYFGSVLPGMEDLSNSVKVVSGVVNTTYADINNLVIQFRNDSVSQQTIKLYYFILGDSAI